MTDDRASEPDAANDRRLVARFLGSRADADFLELYDRHTPGLYRFACRLNGGDGPESADLVQLAWVRALTGLPGFRWGSSLRTWLCGIVLNGWRERRRREERDRRIVDLIAREPRTVGAPEIAMSLAVERAIAELPVGYREILLLHDVEGYTHEEIARHFGIVEGTSKSQLHRARLALREALAVRGARHGA
jgi:RNA polymerase sigma-70 factor (ECF subfamily)